MAKVTQIGQGGDLPFSFDLGEDLLDGRTCTIYVKQHIKDVATISRVIPINEDGTAFDGFLTSAETTTLGVGLWHVFANMPNTSTGQARQVRSASIKFEVQETVVG